MRAGPTMCVLVLCSCLGLAQASGTTPDTTANNLEHSAEYRTSDNGSIPRYVKTGRGTHTLILIAGLGFDDSVFADFVAANIGKYTMYSVTMPGFGNTAAPPMPPAGTSYGAQTWIKSVVQGLAKLIEKEGMQKPIIVGHFVLGAQMALRLAIDYPERIAGVVILGGPAKLIAIQKGEPKEYPLDVAISYTDKYTAPKWFKTISKSDFDAGNYLPEIYSLESIQGLKLWEQSAAVPLPVMIRYLCEVWASDVTVELDKIKCPILVLRATFNHRVLENQTNTYVRPQFIDSWMKAGSKNPLIKIKNVKDAASFVWKDNPKDVYQEIENFTAALQKPISDPKNANRLEPFQFLLGGSWTAEGEIPGFGRYVAERTYRWALDSAFIEQHHHMDLAGHKIDAIGFIGWDTDTKRVHAYGFGNDGGVATTKATTTGTTIVFEGARVGGFNPGPVRGTFLIENDHEFTESVEVEKQGKWIPSLLFRWIRKLK